jgi:hypothetical protein
MKIFYLSALFIAAIQFNTTAIAEDFKPSSNIVTLMPIVMDNLDTLELTSEQLNQVRDISRKSFATVEEINAEYHAIKSELKEELLDFDNQDNAHSKKLLEELIALDKKRMMLTLECTLGLKKILAETKFKEIVSTLEFQTN